jgi:putative adenylate-forming enzyme
MTKSMMMEHFDQINTAGLRREDLVAFRIDQERLGLTDLYPGGFAVGLSSGTSGNKVLTVLSARERAAYSALLLARSGIPRDLEEQRVLFSLRTNNPAFTAVTALGVSLQYVDYFVPIPELVGLVNHHRLNVLAGPPSLLVLLAEEAAKIHGPVEAVIVYAEEADAATKDRLAEAFAAPVSEIYQGAEGMLGFTCRAGNLHLSEDAAFIELDPAGDTLGGAERVVVTDLYRRTQPFIRYELNDLLEVGDRSCPCGSAFRLIDRIHGRSDSVFLLRGTDGGQVRLMPDYVRRSINQASADIIEYQAIQLSPDEIEIRLDVSDGADVEAMRRTITANLEYWATRAHGRIGSVRFSDARPSRDPLSHKLVRVVSRCR